MKKVTTQNSRKSENPEFDRVKDAFKKILAVPKSKIDEIEKRQSKPPQKSKQDCN